METKGIKLGIHQTQAKPKITFAIRKNGNVDAFQPQVQNCYESFLLCHRKNNGVKDISIGQCILHKRNYL